MIPFSDYQLLREVAERFPGSLEIIQGTVLFNDEYINEAWYNPFSWGKGKPQQAPVNPADLTTQQNVMHGYHQRPGQIDTMSNPAFKADVQALRSTVSKLQTPKLQQMMNQWMGKIFKPMRGVSQSNTGALDGPANAQTAPQNITAPNNDMGSIDTGVQQVGPMPGSMQTPGAGGQLQLPGMESPEDQANYANMFGTQSYDTFGNVSQPTGQVPSVNPRVLQMPQPGQQKKAAMWKSMWKH